MNKQEYMKFHEDQCRRMVEITKAKNADYSGAGDDPFNNFRHIKNFINQDGVCEIGFLTRMTDKFSRIGSFISNGTLQVKDESVQDTLLDLANYCILFMGFLEDKKPRLTGTCSLPPGFPLNLEIKKWFAESPGGTSGNSNELGYVGSDGSGGSGPIWTGYKVPPEKPEPFAVWSKEDLETRKRLLDKYGYEPETPTKEN